MPLLLKFLFLLPCIPQSVLIDFNSMGRNQKKILFLVKTIFIVITHGRLEVHIRIYSTIHQK